MVVRESRGNHVRITFRIRADGADQASVVGEFNGWSEDATPMTRVDDEFVADVELEGGRPYRFRYLLDGSRWENDWHADAYVPNDFGGNDSMIDLTDAATDESRPHEPETEPTRQRRASKRA